jgi:FkbM family methyltransferase
VRAIRRFDAPPELRSRLGTSRLADMMTGQRTAASWERAKRIALRLLAMAPGWYRSSSYSHDGEDRILANLFPGQAEGFFVDVGAHHPKRFSNTFLLYQRGWRGINIDPIPGTRRLFEKSRPRDITLELGISNEPGRLEFHLYDEPAFNTFNTAVREVFAKRGFPRFLEARQVPVRPLRDVLDEHLPAGRAIDLLTIDTEGWDLKVLESNDWNRYRPAVIVAEDEGLDMESLTFTPLGAFLREKGYKLVSRTTQSVIWMSRSA